MNGDNIAEPRPRRLFAFQGMHIMKYRVASDRGPYTDRRPKVPHLVCSWSLDPTSHRLSCAWAAPVEGWDTTFARIKVLSLSPRLCAK
jgi:hypothetical protein